MLTNANVMDWEDASPPDATALVGSGVQCISTISERLQELLDLPVGWDGHRGQALSLDTAYFALDLAQRVFLRWTPCPHVVPMSSGGVQLEWHEKGIDLEIEVVAPNEIVVSFEDVSTGVAVEDIEMTTNLEQLAEFIGEITARSKSKAA